MREKIPILLLIMVALCAAGAAEGQVRPAEEEPGSGAPRPLVRIEAAVEADAMHFRRQPRASLRLQGCPEADGLNVVDRRNLPPEIVPGATYREVRIAIVIESFAGVLAAAEAPVDAAASTERLRASIAEALCPPAAAGGRGEITGGDGAAVNGVGAEESPADGEAEAR